MGLNNVFAFYNAPTFSHPYIYLLHPSTPPTRERRLQAQDQGVVGPGAVSHGAQQVPTAGERGAAAAKRHRGGDEVPGEQSGEQFLLLILKFGEFWLSRKF